MNLSHVVNSVIAYPTLQAQPEEYLLKQITDLVSRTKEQAHKIPSIIGIAGISAVGKTTYTQQLSDKLKQLSLRIEIIHLDDFIDRQSPPFLPETWGMRQININKLHSCLKQIKDGATLIELPSRDQMNEQINTKSLNLKNVDLLLFEGIYVLSEEKPVNLFQYCELGIFLKAKEIQQVSEWRREREQKKLKPRSEKELKRLEKEISDYYARNIEPTKKIARFVLKKDISHKLEIFENVDSTKV